MQKYGAGLIGLDVKPRRKVVIRRNCYRATYYRRWLFPALLALVTFGIVVVARTR